METIGAFILGKINQKNLSKLFVYKSLCMTAAGFSRMLENESISFKKYQEICKIVSIDPKEYFNTHVNKTLERGIYELKEPLNEYPKIKYSELEILKENAELKKQNAELIKIISNLTTK